VTFPAGKIRDRTLVAAIDLVKKCIEGNTQKQANVLIFPILGNANHGIKLYLKGIVLY